MAEYKVAAVTEQESWSNDHGQFIGYTMNVITPEGREIQAKINRKPDSSPPAPGEVIDATLHPSKNPAFPPLLKANFSNRAGGGGRSPEDTRAMSRSAAQDRALAYMQVKATMGVLKDDFKPDALLPLIDWFQADVNRFAQGDQPKTVNGLPVRNEPERTNAPEAVTPTPDYALPDGQVMTDTGIPF